MEICQTLGVHRCSVLIAIKADRLPEPISIRRPNGVAHILLWERADVAQNLADWKVALEARKGTK